MTLSPAPKTNRLVKTENALAMLLLALVWLVPNHQLPWMSFHHELAMGVALVAGCVIIGWQTRWLLPVSSITLGAFFFALLPWIQWAGGLIPKFGIAFVSFAYAAAFALAIVIGHAGGLAKDQRLIRILFGALLIASAINVVVQLFQWFQWQPEEIDSFWMVLITPVTNGQRPSGMILQPNLLATLHVWALIALSWFRYNRSIGKFLFIVAFAYIGFGIGLTRSRTGLLEILLITGLMCWVWWRDSERRGIAIAWAVALVLLVILEMNFADLANWIGAGVETAQNRLARGVDGSRIEAWRTFWSAVLERPWAGYGISESGFAYVALAEQRPDLYFGSRFAHAHNIVLDVMIWIGIPLGLLLLGGLCLWLGRQVLELRSDSKRLFPVAVVVALGMHAMLELPHQHLFLLIPAGVCIGSLCAFSSQRHVLSLDRRFWFLLSAGAIAVLISIAHDYFPYQNRYTDWRFENQRIGEWPNTPIHQPLVLNQLRDEIELYRMPLKAGVPLQELEWIEQTARAVNSPNAYYIAAKAFALSGKPIEASVWMRRFNAIMKRAEVENVQSMWKTDQLEHPSLADLQWPDYMGK